MSQPAQTQVTLDASQFIAAVDNIGNSIDAMNKNLASAGTAFNAFAASASGMEKSLQSLNSGMTSLNTSMASVATNTANTTQAIAALNPVLSAIAQNTAKAVTALNNLGQAGAKAGQAGARGAQQMTFAWDGIARLLAVTVIRRLFLDIAGAIHTSVQASADYTEQVGRIVALNQNLGVSVEQLSGQFSNLALAYGRTLKEVADVGRIASTAGGAQTAQQIEQISDAAIRLAEVTGQAATASATSISAIIQGFRLGAAESQNVSNQLIHIAQSGIGLEALQGSIGRLSAQSQRLGINFSELGLLMEELKATGLSDTEVFSQIGAVLNSLERPTQRMTELLGQQGFLSPQQLIQAQRLHGALQLINQDISDGNIQARQAVQSRRAGGGLSVAESFAQRSQNNPLENVNQLNEGANAALRIVDATGRWNDELEKIKATFQSEVAPAIIKSILDIFEPMGGLAKVVIDAGRTISLLVDPVARIVSWFSVWTNWITQAGEALGILDGRIRTNADALREHATAARAGTQELNNWLSAQQQASRQTLQEGTQRIANLFAPVNAALKAQGDRQREQVHNLGEEIQAASKSIFGAFGAQIESLESAARHAEGRITESLKRVAEFGDKTDKDTFNHKVKSAGEVSQVNKFSSPVQATNAFNLLQAQNSGTDSQLNLIRDRRRRLTEEITALQRKGDADSIASARRKFEELRALNDQEADLRQGRSRRVSEYEGRRTGQNQTFNPYNREREAGARSLNAAESAFEEANRRRLAEQQAQLDKINRSLREQFALSQTGQRDVGRLPQRLFQPGGGPQQNFQGEAGGRRAQGVINDTIDRQIENVQKLPQTIEAGIAEALRTGAITQEQARQARARAPSPQEVAAVVNQLEQQRLATQAMFQNAEAQRISQANQARAIAILQQIATNTQAANADIARNAEQRRGLVQRGIEQVGQIDRGLPSNFEVGIQAILSRSAGGDDPTIASDNEAVRVVREIRDTLVPAARAALTRAAGSNNPEDVQRAVAALQALLDAQRVLQENRPNSDPNNRISLLQDTIRQLNERLAQLPVLQAVADVHRGEQQQANAAIQNAANAAGAPQAGANGVIPPATLQQSITAFENLATALNPGGQVSNALGSLATDMATAGERIRAATANLQPQQPRQDLPVNPRPAANGGDFAEGGLIGNTFSNFGPDNTMINARRGEFVVNPDSTRKFYATLVAINRGDRPRGGGYAHGGTVSTSIGNMNFHVSGAEQPEQTARAVMKIIRREQRRGNV